MSFNPFAGGIIQRVAPTTQAQREVLASAQMNDEANTAFNEAVAIKISGPIAVERLSDSLNALVARHETLSVTFSRRGDEICLQDSKFSLQHIDLREQSGTEQEAYLQHLKRNIAISPMNLEEGPLFFAWLVDLGVNEEGVLRSELILAVHHLVCDGWTLGILLNELSRIYENNGLASCLEPAPSFLDYAERQQASAATNRDIDYWKAAFEHIPANMDLPLDFPRPAHRTFSAKRLDFEIGKDLSERLKGASASLKSSQVNIVLASYFLLLQKLSRNDDLVVGLPVAGQAATDQHALAGHMVQLLPIRLQMSDTWSFRDLLHSVKSRVLDASERPNFTFGELVKDMPVDRSRVPLINTIFNIDQAMPSLKFGDARGVVETVPRAAENFEMFLNVMPNEDGLTVETTYSTALFREETIRAWMQALEHLLEQGLTEPNKKLVDFTLASELPESVVEKNKTEASLASPTILSAISEQVKKTPKAIAVKAGSLAFSYAQLWERVQKMAAALLHKGVSENNVVGICCARDENLLIATLAVHQAGAAYLPLDPSFPEERLRYMLKDSGAKAVIGDDNASRLFGPGPGPEVYSFEHLLGFDDPNVHAFPADRAGRLAYLIYTSGSTGLPKGVAISCHSMANFVESMCRVPGCESTDVLLAVTTLAFDISVLELFMPLTCGACVVIASEQDTKDAELLSDLISSHNVSILQATPATWRLLLGASWANNRYAKFKALCGGEPLPKSLAIDLLGHVGQLWNMFGPTETTVWSSCKEITLPLDHITVGSAIQNTQLLVLDDLGAPVPISVPGEICIGGQGLAIGYHERFELTAERFVEHPKYGRIYRTGDLGKWRCDGELEHLGRMDDQVKVRGYRIELGEIESAISQQEGIERAVVYLWHVNETDLRIVACCIPESGKSLQVAQLRKTLRNRLPVYMIPQYFLTIDAVPLTPNGKVDRKSLPRPEVNVSSLVAGQLNSETEKSLAGLWVSLLQTDVTIGGDDSFFELGGHSLLALEAIRQIENRFGTKFSMRDLIASKLSEIAEKIDAQQNSSSITEQSGPAALAAKAVRYASAEQIALYNYQLSNPDSVNYNLPASWRLKGDVKVDLLILAFERLLQRQTALRTSFALVGGKLQTGILPLDSESWFDVELVEDGSVESAKQRAVELASKPFDLSDLKLIRAKLFQLSKEDYLLFICPHQLIFDGWSFDIFLKELEQNYVALSARLGSQLVNLPFEYRDYGHWQKARFDTNGESLPENRDFHSKALSIEPWIDLSDKYNKEYSFGRVTEVLSLDQLKVFEQFCQEYDIRPHECLTAVYLEALFIESNASELCIALPVTGRYRPEVIGLIGGFISSLPFYAQRPNTDSFVEQCKALSISLSEFHSHQDICFAELQTDGSTISLNQYVPSSFAFQDIRNRPVKLADLELEQIDIAREGAMFSLEAWARIEADKVLLVADYNEAYFDSARVRKVFTLMLDRLNNLSGKSALKPVISDDSGGEQKSFWRRLFK